MGKLYTADNFVTIGGTTDQYVTGAGTLVTFPPIPSGGVDGTGTANYVSKWLDSNTIADSVIFDNGTNVGIGTASPGAKLDVAGALGGTVGVGGSTVRLVNTDTGNAASITAGIVGIQNEGMQFATDGVVNMVIASSRVGINTTAPTHRFTSNVSAMSPSGDQDYPIFASVAGRGVVLGYDTNNDISIINGVHTSVAWKGIALATVGGNVGIGTTTPSAKLDVTGGDAIINTVTVGRGGGSVSSNTVLGRNALDANSTGANNICVGSGAAAGLSNNASGRVVIGTDLFLTPNLDDIGNDELVIGQYNQNAASFQLPHIYVPKPLSIPNGATTDVIAFDLGHYVGAFVEYIIYLDDGSDYAMGTVYMAWKPSGSGNFKDVRQIEWGNMSNFTFSLGGIGTTLTLDNTSSNNAWIRITVRAMMTN